MARIGSVQWNAKAHCEIPLQIGRVVANEMSPVLVLNGGLDALEQTRPLEELETERARGVVVGREQRQSPHSVATNNSRQQPEIIFDHARMDRLRRNINQLRPWLGQKQEEKQKTLFVSLDLETTHCHLERNGRHDDDCLLILVEGFDRAPERNQLLLQSVKLRGRFLRGKPGRQT